MKLSLSKKPAAAAVPIEDLLERVRHGEIRLPEFQRLYRWDASDVIGLFDSIVRGFPIGTFLFWQKPVHAAAGRALEVGAAIDRPADTSLLFVLDGQQRLTSLAGVLLSPTEPEEDRFRIAFSLESDEFKQIPRGEPWPARAVPLYRVLDSVELVTWATDHRLDRPGINRALEIGKAIREYKVPEYVVVADDEETARLIYDRVNSSGKRLSKEEVFKGLQEGMALQSPNTLEGLKRSIEDLQFGPLRESLFLQAATAVAGLDVTHIDHETLSRRELGDSLPVTAPALRKAITFLMEHAHIPTATLLPYGFPIVALTRFFSRHPSPRARSLDLLSRWVWRGAITGKHWTHEMAYLRETLSDIRGDDEEEEVQRMMRRLPRSPTEPSVGLFRLKSAESRLHLLALASFRPRLLRSGVLLDPGSLVHALKGSAVPRLLETGDDETAEGQARKTIFGRVIQPSASADLHEALRSARDNDQVLESVGLNRDEAERVLAGEPFALVRKARLSPRFTAFFEQRARWTESDRPSLEALIVEDGP